MTTSERAIDPEAGITSKDSALGEIQGLIDRNPASLFFDGQTLVAIANHNPDAVRRAAFLDIYAEPRFVTAVVAWAMSEFAEKYQGWSLVPGANTRDAALIAAYEGHGLQVIRRYWIMRRDTAPLPQLPVRHDVEIVKVDLQDDEALRLWHSTHLDAFSEHFAFVPRPFDSFKELVFSEPGLDREGVFLAWRGGEPVGYLECSDELVDDGFGSIARLGVVKSARGLGIGELLLGYGVKHSAQKGYSKVELSVDSGNQSGALRLYEKLGFEVAMSWLQLSNNPDFGRPANYSA